MVQQNIDHKQITFHVEGMLVFWFNAFAMIGTSNSKSGINITYVTPSFNHKC